MTAQADVKRYELLIGGQAVAPGGGAYSSIIDPSTETPIASVAQGTAADVDRAVQAARAALKPWNAIRASERGRILMRFAELMRTHQDEIAAVESLDAGKPISGVQRQDVPAAIDTLAYYAGWCDKINGQVVPTRPDALTYTVREPVGVVAAIIPWNGPVMLIAYKLAPALLAGCTVILKASPEAPGMAYIFAQIAEEIGLPPGVVNVVTADRAVSELLVRHPDVDKISFTGSSAAGKKIASICGERIARCTLELGGKSAAVILDDYEVGAAAKIRPLFFPLQALGLPLPAPGAEKRVEDHPGEA